MTDLEKAKAIAEEIKPDEKLVDELHDIIMKNQNERTGDGSFNKVNWQILKHITHSAHQLHGDINKLDD